jgi:pimeloyl-ACP methyl ester carboxylesterase
MRRFLAIALVTTLAGCFLAGCFVGRRELARVRDEVTGPYITFEERIFSQGITTLGIWKHKRYWDVLGFQVYQVRERDPATLPVVLVHGYNGNASSMTYLGEKLAPAKFTPIYVQYPTGHDLDEVARAMAPALERLELDAFGLVGYSMGGLVARKFLGYWDGSAEVPVYVSMAVPYGGVEMGSRGHQIRPYEPDSYDDMVPGSEFLDHLFDDPLPEETGFQLVYALSEGRPGVPGFDDGLVSFESAKREEALEEADTVTEIRAVSHGSLLSKKEPTMKVVELLLDAHAAWLQ